MSGRTYALVAALALLSVAGIVGMLLSDGAWDLLFFAMAAVPLAFGAWRRWRVRRAAD